MMFNHVDKMDTISYKGWEISYRNADPPFPYDFDEISICMGFYVARKHVSLGSYQWVQPVWLTVREQVGRLTPLDKAGLLDRMLHNGIVKIKHTINKSEKGEIKPELMTEAMALDPRRDLEKVKFRQESKGDYIVNPTEEKKA